VDSLSLLKAMALWTVVDEDLLRCLCCAESLVGAGCDGFVGGCGSWICDAGLVAEAENLLMSLAVSTWWLPLVCVRGSKSAWIYGHNFYGMYTLIHKPI
jgi:hypothetical protein